MKESLPLKENLFKIQENIACAAKKSGRKAEDILLVAVTKTIPAEIMQEAFELGCTHFGENRVQELLPKYDYFGEINSPTWHMIGHLQTNKVRSVIGKVKLIHSVDSLRLAEEINKRSSQKSLVSEILIEINIAGEDTKQGTSPADAIVLTEQIQCMSNIRVKGLMCVAPYVEQQDQNRVWFEKMHKLFIDIEGRKLHNTEMRYLSMGMSGDYEAAIETGANIVRVGTGIFGSRK